MKRALCLAIVTAALGTGCSQGSDADRAKAPVSPAVAEGAQVYATNCTACHNADPNQAGSLGPALAGSPEALLQAKVLHNEYPPGYTPKRDSHAMVPLPHLANEIPALAAYLGSVAKGS
jgi:mono/diheme cytochrome c family protein